MLFISSWKLFSFSRHLNVCVDFWPFRNKGSIRKRSFQNFWSHSLVNKQLHYTYSPTSHEVKVTRKWNLSRQWDQFQTSFCFFKKLSMRSKRGVCCWFQFNLIVLKLVYNKNKLYKTLDHLSRDMLNFDFLEKKSKNIISTTFWVWLIKKNVSQVIL